MKLISCEKLEKSMVELQFSIDAETFKSAVNTAFKREGKKYAIPGFRKGKAPKAMIEKMYGKDLFQYDAINDLFPENYEAAVKEAGIEVVGRPEPEVVSMSEEEGATLKVKVAVKPEVELGEYTGLTVNKDVKTVDEADVDAEIKRMQDRNGRLLTREGASENGDTVDIDFEGFVDGKAFEGGKAEKYELTIGSNQFIPGFEDQIIGHKIGDKFDVNVKFPEDYQADLASKDAVFKIKLHGIKVKEVPALDDEFAKDVSEFDTLDELKKDIKKQLEKRKNDDAENELHNTLLEEVAKGIKAEIPEAMIEKTIDDDVNEYSYRLQSQGLKLETYLKYTGMDMKGFREGFKERAETQVRLNLALEKIIEKEKIEVTEEDIEAEYKKYADAYNMDIDTIKKAVSAESLKPELASRKAIDLIVDSAVVTEEKAAKKTAEKKPATKKATAKKPAAKKTSEKADDKKSADKAE